MARLRIDGVEKAFAEKQVLRGVSEDFEPGRIYAILGRNGAGKTTLFRIIEGLLEADAGTVLLDEDGIGRPLETRDIFMVRTEPELPQFLTGREFLKFYTDVNRSKIRDLRPLDEYFDLVDFDIEDRDRLIQEYSSGMKAKVQMLMCLILRPLILLMDEPLNSLDVVVQLEMKKLIRSLKDEHIILFSTHILQLASDIADDLVLLVNGKLHELAFDPDHYEDLEAAIVGELSVPRSASNEASKKSDSSVKKEAGDEV